MNGLGGGRVNFGEINSSICEQWHSSVDALSRHVASMSQIRFMFTVMVRFDLAVTSSPFFSLCPFYSSPLLSQAQACRPVSKTISPAFLQLNIYMWGMIKCAELLKSAQQSSAPRTRPVAASPVTVPVRSSLGVVRAEIFTAPAEVAHVESVYTDDSSSDSSSSEEECPALPSPGPGLPTPVMSNGAMPLVRTRSPSPSVGRCLRRRLHLQPGSNESGVGDLML